MTQRYDHLWHYIVSFENLLLAYRRAARGKRSKSNVGALRTIWKKTCSPYARN